MASIDAGISKLGVSTRVDRNHNRIELDDRFGATVLLHVNGAGQDETADDCRKARDTMPPRRLWHSLRNSPQEPTAGRLCCLPALPH